MNAPRALGIGLAQAVAILPGISRAGSTIAAARHLGIPAARAAEFSLLMSLPMLLGGVLLTLVRPDAVGGTGTKLGWGVLALGAAVAAVVGYGAIRLLLRVLAGRHFWWFGVYCLLAGTVLLIVL